MGEEAGRARPGVAAMSDPGAHSRRLRTPRIPVRFRISPPTLQIGSSHKAVTVDQIPGLEGAAAVAGRLLEGT